MLSDILSTPNSIHDAVMNHFIFAELDVISTNPVQLEINLQPGLPILKLSSAVDAKIFKRALNSYYLCIENADIAGSTSPPPYLNPARFTLPQPLTDWKKYCRTRFEAEGGGVVLPLSLLICKVKILNHHKN